MPIQINPIEPFYEKENGVLVYRIDDDSVPLPFTVRYKSLIYLPPKEIGGNHKHARQEAFLGSQHLEFAWIDEDGSHRRIPMMQNEQPLLIVVSPYIAHAVINVSDSEQAILFEYADDPILTPERVLVVEQ